jgi:hypothetical protein
VHKQILHGAKSVRATENFLKEIKRKIDNVKENKTGKTCKAVRAGK